METSDIPAAHTMMAAGLVPYDDERALGMIGMHGSVTANEALFHADLVLALGTRFSDRVALNIEKFSPEAVKIQVDIDPCEVNKNVPVDQYIVGDVKDFMERLLPLLEKREHPAWRGKIAEWQKEQEKVAYRGEGLHPAVLRCTAFPAAKRISTLRRICAGPCGKAGAVSRRLARHLHAARAAL